MTLEKFNINLTLIEEGLYVDPPPEEFDVYEFCFPGKREFLKKQTEQEEQQKRYTFPKPFRVPEFCF